VFYKILAYTKGFTTKGFRLRIFALLALCFSLNVSSHEVQSTTQYLTIPKTNQTGWIQDISARAILNKKYDLGAMATYLERFNLYEKRVGGFLTFRPSNKLTLEAHFIQGVGNKILPEKQTTLSAYYALATGHSPFLFYYDSRYTVTNVQRVNMGVEIERLANIIFIPSFTLGRATFSSPAQTEEIYNYGFRAIYYKEKKYSFTAWTYKGKEASQGIILLLILSMHA
jgi:hypothetical protein